MPLPSIAETVVSEHWERCSEYIQKALDHGGNTHGLDDVKSAVLDGRATFWPGRSCALITEVITYPRLRALNIWLAGGDLGELLTYAGAIRNFATQLGCDRLQITGRAGWQRVLGAKAAGTIITEDLR